MSFPPIWTEIEADHQRNGNISYQLLSHSLFQATPSMPWRAHWKATCAELSCKEGRVS